SVTDLLLAGALAALARHGVADDAIDVATVPGAFELPLCAQRLAATGRYDALVCLGAVVRGETPHFDYVAAEAARGIADVARRPGARALGPRAARAERGFTRGDRKSAGREAPEHWTGPRVGRSRSLPASWSTASPRTASASTRSSRRARNTGGCRASRAWT